MTLRSFLSFICSTPDEGSRLLVATNTRFTNGHWRQAASPPHLVRGCWERTVQRGWCRDVLSDLEERELTGPEGENEYIQILLKQTTTGYRVWPTCSTVFSCLGLDYVRASRICLQRSCMFDILTCFLIILYILIGVSWQITKRSLRKEIKSSAITSSINSKSGSQQPSGNGWSKGPADDVQYLSSCGYGLHSFGWRSIRGGFFIGQGPNFIITDAQGTTRGCCLKLPLQTGPRAMVCSRRNGSFNIIQRPDLWMSCIQPCMHAMEHWLFVPFIAYYSPFLLSLPLYIYTIYICNY